METIKPTKNQGVEQPVLRPKAQPKANSDTTTKESSTTDRFESSQHQVLPISPEIVKFDSNQDGKVDIKDNSYENLHVWRDRNHNGVKEEGEVQSLSQAGIHKIDPKNTMNENIIQGQMGVYHQAPEQPKINLEG